MTDNSSVQRIRTTLGDVPIDYEYLINKPETIKTLVLDKVKSGDFADAKAVATELQNVIKKIETIQKSASSNNQNISSITTTLNNNGITSDTNFAGDIKDINSNISSLTGGSKPITSTSSLKKILDANKLSESTNITQNFTNIDTRVAKLESFSGLAPSKTTNWNTITSNGWYYSDSSTVSTDNSPGNIITGLGCYIGEVYIFEYGLVKYIHQKVYGIIKGNYILRRSFERNGIGTTWGAWYETTPIYQTITENEFKTLIEDK